MKHLVLLFVVACGAGAPPRVYHAPNAQADVCKGARARHPVDRAPWPEDHSTYDQSVGWAKCFSNVSLATPNGTRRCQISVHTSIPQAADRVKEQLGKVTNDDRGGGPPNVEPGGDRFVQRKLFVYWCQLDPSTASAAPDYKIVDDEIDAYMAAFAPDDQIIDVYAPVKSAARP